MARKSKPLIIDQASVIDIDSKGRGVVKHDELVIFVKDTCPGDVIKLRTTRKRKSYYEGVVEEIISPSEARQEPFCKHFEDCGGCKLQHISYEDQLKFKEKQVHDAIERIAKIPFSNYDPILACENTTFYRNKLEFSASHRRWISYADAKSNEDIDTSEAIGFHVPGRFDKIVHVEKCHFQPDPSNAIRNFVHQYAKDESIDFYDLYKHQGSLRTVMIRNNKAGDFMVVLMVSSTGLDFGKKCLETVYDKFSEVKSASLLVNDKVNDSFYDIDAQLICGSPFITETIGDLTFNVDAKSFLQTNTDQTLLLYQLAEKYAGLQGDEVVYDLFCGVGTIGLFLSKKCKEVIGIETVPEAIIKAKENAVNNGIENVRFETGSVEHVLSDDFKSKYPRPDVVITDPPRMGMHQKVIDGLLEMLPEKIVYVSCNPSTQARDIALLAERYDLSKLQPVDMFPHTPHVESVALLTLRTSNH